MPVFFKFSNDGELMFVAKTLINREMSEKEFDEKAKIVGSATFINNAPEKYKEKLISVRRRLNELYNMKIGQFTRTLHSNPVSRTTTAFYRVGTMTFIDQTGEDVEHKEKGDAITHAQQLFGKEAAEKYMHEVCFNNKEFYFANGQEISKDEYKELTAEVEKLTSMVCLGREKKQEAGKKK